MSDRISYTPEEVASILKISRYTVYEMVKRGDLGAYRIGRKIRIEKSDVEKYIENSKQPQNIFEGEVKSTNGIKYVEIGNIKIRAITDLEGKVKLSLRPEDIILANNIFESSARNILKCNVKEIIYEGSLAKVKLDAGIILSALITKQALEEMQIDCGKTIYAVFKSTAVRIFK